MLCSSELNPLSFLSERKPYSLLKLMQVPQSSTPGPQTQFSSKPMSFGRILDRALRLTPGVMLKIIIPLTATGVISLTFGITGQLDQNSKDLLVRSLISCALLPLQWYLLAAVMIIGIDAWQKKDSSLISAAKRLGLSKFMKLAFLYATIAVRSLLYTLLLVIPGIIYSLNRALAPYIFLIEDCSYSEAMSKSKNLMCKEKWYSLRGPYTKVTAIFILMYLANVLFAGIALTLTLYLSHTSSIHLLGYKLLNLIQFLLNVTTSIFVSLCFTGLYYDLSARYEGKDILSDIEAFRSQGT